MQSPHYMRTRDRVEPRAAPTGAVALDVTPFLGTWLNTNSATRGIAKIILENRGNTLTVHAFAACEPAPCDWGEIQAETIYADRILSHKGIAFTALYDLGFMESHLQANVNQGLLVVASLTTFQDGSGRSNYFSREFFHLRTGSAER